MLNEYILGDYKLISGIVRDDNYYMESSTSGLFLNTSTPRMVSYVMECVIRAAETFLGAGPFDTTRIIFTHKILQVTTTSCSCIYIEVYTRCMMPLTVYVIIHTCYIIRIVYILSYTMNGVYVTSAVSDKRSGEWGRTNYPSVQPKERPQRIHQPGSI